MEIVASMNPVLEKYHYFTVELEEFVYPNTEAPKFLSSLKTIILLSVGEEFTY